MGYDQAGYDVTGVVIEPQPNYPFDLHQADAMTFPLDGYDIVHASPPCQAYSSATRAWGRAAHPDLYVATRERLQQNGAPWVIENVIGAPYDSGIVLCGAAFGLQADGEWLRRHRNMESSLMLPQPAHTHPDSPRPITVGGHTWVSEVTQYKHSRQGTFDLVQRLMGIDWMTRKEIGQAIPPAYTRYIGERFAFSLASD